ncbi:MAG: hypothetical protein U0T36_04790 [Saprospiraceae bacterium]
MVGSVEIAIVAFGRSIGGIFEIQYLTSSNIHGRYWCLALRLGLFYFDNTIYRTPQSASRLTYTFNLAPSVAIAILILLFVDTLRVFILRVMEGKSPFNPDRKHIHHILIDVGLTHMQATGVLFVTNILFILLAIMLQNIGNLMLLVIILILAWILTWFASSLAVRKKQLSK